MKNIALHNLGCKVNAYEIEVMQQKFTKKGYNVVPFAPGADIYVINTCTVTNIADRKSRQMLHKAKKMNPNALVVATGCYVQTGQDNIKMDNCIDLAVGNNCKKDIVEIVEDFLEKRKEESEKQLHVIDINKTDEYEEMQLERTGEHTRAYIKIQDGCNQFCSYCIIPYARGRVRSRKREDIIKEIKGLVEEGYQEIVLTGIHLSSYGLDFIDKNTRDYLEGEKDIREAVYKKEFLLSLIEEIHEISGLKRIRLGSLEPRIITERFAEKLASLTKVCPHFHLSLQSGSNGVLKRMNRRYTAEEYYDKVEILRKYFVNPAITTDIITGFPGETEQEFEETIAFVKKVNFFEVHIFKYSKRAGTVAASMEGQITEQVKAERSNRLSEIVNIQSKEYRLSFVNKPVSVLLEEVKQIEGKNYMVGHTPEYVMVAYPTQEDLSNKILEGKGKEWQGKEMLLLEL